MEQQFIEARCGGNIFYIEKSKLRSVIGCPAIFEVPGAPEGIRGIARYDGQPVVFYKAAELKKALCAVLMNDGDGLFGFEAEEIGEELSAADRGEGQTDKRAFRQILPGVWEENIDTIE